MLNYFSKHVRKKKRSVCLDLTYKNGRFRSKFGMTEKKAVMLICYVILMKIRILSNIVKRFRIILCSKCVQRSVAFGMTVNKGSSVCLDLMMLVLTLEGIIILNATRIGRTAEGSCEAMKANAVILDSLIFD